ncbi:DUF2612 domain-containing protein [Muricomes intestini]|jgi:hypothetical protein|uniref:DUF2612 domain-containing protein n=1 Tax=Muricomes intestini TaxID=1796634 RepID=UPI002FDDAF53
MDYHELVIPEHRAKPKFLKWLDSAINPPISAQDTLNNLHNQFDIDKAVGVQLDRIGDILGVPRNLPFQPSDGISSVMLDENYRAILRAAIAKEHFNGAVPCMYSLMQLLLGKSGLYLIVIDNQDMSVEIIIFGKIDSLIKDEIEHGMIVPRPEGVSMTINITENKIFSWGLDNEVFSGWGNGYWLPVRNNF